MVRLVNCYRCPYLMCVNEVERHYFVCYVDDYKFPSDISLEELAQEFNCRLVTESYSLTSLGLDTIIKTKRSFYKLRNFDILQIKDPKW